MAAAGWIMVFIYSGVDEQNAIYAHTYVSGVRTAVVAHVEAWRQQDGDSCQQYRWTIVSDLVSTSNQQHTSVRMAVAVTVVFKFVSISNQQLHMYSVRTAVVQYGSARRQLSATAVAGWTVVFDLVSISKHMHTTTDAHGVRTVAAACVTTQWRQLQVIATAGWIVVFNLVSISKHMHVIAAACVATTYVYGV